MKLVFSAYGAIVFIMIMVLCVLLYYVYGIVDNIDDIKNKFIELYEWGNAQNEFATAGISLWLLGVITYLARDIPDKVWQFIVKQSTVTLTLNNCDDIYNAFLTWYHETGRSKRSRTLIAQDGDFDDAVVGGGATQISSGYGFHFFTFNGRIFSFERTEKEAGMSRQVKETIKIKTIGRSQEQFLNLLAEIQNESNDAKTTRIFKWVPDEEYWSRQGEQAARPLDSVILPSKIKNEILTHLDTFLAERAWYVKNGIPYRTGMILHGVPGTGKTSLVQGLCEYLNKPLYVISPAAATIESLDGAFGRLPRNSICLMEDIDAYQATTAREGISTNEGLPKLLNAIDGVAASDGRIIIATTNKLDKLDAALIRKGRFNLSVNIGYLTEECFRKFFANFYPNFPIVPDTKFREEMSPADLQALIIDNREDPAYVLSKCIIENKA